jgi:AcrR family transcriptional regulator
MGRKAGVTADETKADLLRAAAKVFARDGFEGASIADITAEAGLSSGPIYLHYGSKAELFAAVLQTNADREFDTVLGDSQRHDVTTVLATLGADLSRQKAESATLLIEAITAARRDPVLAGLLSQLFAQRQARLASLIASGQDTGDVDVRVSPNTVAHFSMVIGLGSLLINSLDLPADRDEWAELISTVVRGLKPR